MGRINWARVVLRGMLAGLVMNVGEAVLHGGVLGEDGVELFRSYNVPDSPNPFTWARSSP